MNIFDILNNISETHTDISDDPKFNDVYNSFMINKFLSMELSCVRYVSYMNNRIDLPKKLQYLFYLYSIPNRKRFFKYAKKENKNIESISKYYYCREELALIYKKLLNKKKMKKINEMHL